MSSLAGDTPQQKQELWVNVMNKETGQPYKTIFNCTSIQRFEAEEPELAKRFVEAFNKWYAVPANQQLLNYDKNNRDGCGFKFVDGDFEYKLLQFTRQDGSGTFRTLGKRKISSKSGSGGSRPYTLLRTTQVQFMRKEDLAGLINNQNDNECYEITYLGTDAEGQEFMVEKKDQYVPMLIPKDSNANESKEGSEQAQE